MTRRPGAAMTRRPAAVRPAHMPLTALRLVLAIMAAGGLAPAHAVEGVSTASVHTMLQPAETTELTFHQHPGAALPLDARFRDSGNRSVRLGDFFHGAPVILVLEYLRCRGLCGVVIQDAARALALVPLAAGHDYQVVVVSIDPRDDPRDAQTARAKYLPAQSRRTALGWHFLTGRPAAIEAVARAVGFSYRYDPAVDQYAHPAGITIATPAGRVARYVLGVGYRPLDVRLALSEASQGRISSPAADLLLLCYCYDPGTGRYSFAIRGVTRALCGATVLGLGGWLLGLARTRRARDARHESETGPAALGADGRD